MLPCLRLPRKGRASKVTSDQSLERGSMGEGILTNLIPIWILCGQLFLFFVVYSFHGLSKTSPSKLWQTDGHPSQLPKIPNTVAECLRVAHHAIFSWGPVGSADVFVLEVPARFCPKMDVSRRLTGHSCSPENQGKESALIPSVFFFCIMGGHVEAYQSNRLQKLSSTVI